MWRDIGMAVLKRTATRCRDRAYKHCTNNPIPISPFHAQCHFPVISEHNWRKMSFTFTKLWCRAGEICAVFFVCNVSTVVLGTAIPTSFHIWGKFVIYYCYTVICTVAYKCIVAACKLYLCCFLFVDGFVWRVWNEQYSSANYFTTGYCIYASFTQHALVCTEERILIAIYTPTMIPMQWFTLHSNDILHSNTVMKHTAQ